MLPSTGWLNVTFNATPEKWPLPEKYVGVYVDPNYDYDKQHFEVFRKQPPAKVGDTGITQNVLALGEVSVESLVGRSFITDIDGVKITMTQSGVFAVLLFDSIVLPVIPKCFFAGPSASDFVQTPEVALVADRIEEAPASFALTSEVVAVAGLADEGAVAVAQTDEVAETCKGCT